MALTVNIYYKGVNGNAKKFADEMIKSGVVDKIKSESGNLKYDYFYPIDDEETVLLIDSWENQEALDIHHSTSMMQDIVLLREKYDLTMKVEKYITDENNMTENDKKYVRDKK